MTKKVVGKLPKIVADQLSEVSRLDLEPAESVPIVGKFFMTVKLGQYVTIDAIRKTIIAGGGKISDYANEIFDKIYVSAIKQEVDLWEVTAAELGFMKYVPCSDIFIRAVELGFVIIPAEAIALARIKCGDNKWRIGGMEPIVVSDGDLDMLSLNSYGHDFSLSTECDGSGRTWHPGIAWIFSRTQHK